MIKFRPTVVTQTPDSGRRNLLKGAVVGSSLLSFPALVRSASDRKIVCRDPGGPFTPGFAAAYYDDFEKASGITAVGIQGDHEPTGLIKAMVDTKTYTWDCALLSKSSHKVVANGGYLAPIYGSGGPGPNMSQIPESMRGEFISGNDVYATLMCYRTDTPLGKNPPKSWADFWDVDKFPGARAARKHPYDTLEFALMADGVAPEDVYPLDVDRAFKSMDRIKPHIDIWWTGGAQTSQLLKTGEVDLTFTWNGRSQVAIDDGAPVEMVWKGAMWAYEGWCILKGGPNVDLCRVFAEYAADGERQAKFTPHVAYGPTNPSAYAHIDPDRAKVLPTNPKYLPHMLAADDVYWGEHKDAIMERFNTWLLS